MRNNHWSVNCAVVYLIFIFIVNCAISIWSTIEFKKLTHDYNSGQVGEESLSDSLGRMVDNTHPNEAQIYEDEINEIQGITAIT